VGALAEAPAWARLERSNPADTMTAVAAAAMMVLYIASSWLAGLNERSFRRFRGSRDLLAPAANNMSPNPAKRKN
jgi:hypothetical protein